MIGQARRSRHVAMLSTRAAIGAIGDHIVSLEFLITTLIVVISPGTGALYTIAAGLTRGRNASLWAAVGCTLGTVPHMIAAITGLAAILHTSALAFEIIKYAGVAYLLYMAWSTLRETGTLSVETNQEAKSAANVISESSMSESFVKTFKRDYVRINPLPDAVTALGKLAGWFEDYNENHPHSGLRMRSPREFIRAQTQ